jgi:DNA-binding phage protein
MKSTKHAKNSKPRRPQLTAEQRAHFRRAHAEEEAGGEQTQAQARAMFASIADTPKVIAILVQARRDADISIAQVAARMGVAASSVSRLEATTKFSGNPTLKTLASYAAAVGVELQVNIAAKRRRGAA